MCVCVAADVLGYSVQTIFQLCRCIKQLPLRKERTTTTYIILYHKGFLLSLWWRHREAAVSFDTGKVESVYNMILQMESNIYWTCRKSKGFCPEVPTSFILSPFPLYSISRPKWLNDTGQKNATSLTLTTARILTTERKAQSLDLQTFKGAQESIPVKFTNTGSAQSLLIISSMLSKKRNVNKGRLLLN